MDTLTRHHHSVWQLWNSSPQSFEFNEDFLLFVIDSVYDSRFGTFLVENAREREEEKIKDKARAVICCLYMLARMLRPVRIAFSAYALSSSVTSSFVASAGCLPVVVHQREQGAVHQFLLLCSDQISLPVQEPPEQTRYGLPPPFP
jgi:hypothetical protein